MEKNTKRATVNTNNFEVDGLKNDLPKKRRKKEEKKEMMLRTATYGAQLYKNRLIPACMKKQTRFQITKVFLNTLETNE